MNDVMDVRAKNTMHISYPNIPFAMRPVLHSDELKVQISPKDWSNDDSEFQARKVLLISGWSTQRIFHLSISSLD